ncbi:ATP-NAD kinase family protein [Lutispora saccharofermentans]|uniref:ATP-NAD kinase family protein n=1 Tax=Lutispora saccharofermentans TaxID=3024236 RepID=A0ABT1NJN9_9FIRM|nr:ATP-NAD kinase family protein [Lutispora saccharofermentans]MCQ1531294.1 ATP-NAD kinase family protein [Lutispora saccharofermentans]
MKKLGLIINPIAGMGGSVGLKGTDGVLDKALELGAVPRSPQRGKKALEELLQIKDEIEILTCSGSMGESEALELGFNTRLVCIESGSRTSSADTLAAAKSMLDEGADLILFAGGDGTARDIYKAVGDKAVVVGIPAGVKIHSPIYAQTPAKAGELARLYLTEKITKVQEAEVLDINEDAYRAGKVTTSLYGYLKIPFEKKYVQNRKAGTPMSQQASQNAIALDIIDNMEAGVYYIIGPGTTTRPVMENLKLPYTLLGVDVVLNKGVFALDVAEKQLVDITSNNKCKLIITPIGGQGYLFGRGNQQLSYRVLKAIGKENIIVAATKEKLSELRGNPFLVDTGDEKTDNMLSGYIGVITGYREKTIYKVKV